MAEIEWDTPADQFLAAAKEVSDYPACTQASQWMETWCTSERTIGAAVDVFISDKAADDAWACWVILNLSPRLGDTIRAGFIRKITDPMQAFKLRERILASATETDLQALLLIYDGKLPNVESN